MASMIGRAGAESEMEEGEIVDDVDDLSDISSEEEFLLRQRLQVLEKYNNVLGRKKTKAKHSSRTGYKRHVLLPDLSEVSGSEFEDILQATQNQSITVYHNRRKPHPRTGSENDQPLVTPEQSKTVQHTKKARPFKPHEKSYEPTFAKREQFHHIRKKDRRKKLQLKIISETSESESDDEYRNKRRKLADAVSVLSKVNNDKSSLQARLKKMLNGSNSNEDQTNTINQPVAILHPEVKDASCSPIAPKLTVTKEEWEEAFSLSRNKDVIIIDDEKENQPKEIIEVSTDDDMTVHAVTVSKIEGLDSVNTVDSCAKEIIKEKSLPENEKRKETNSDDDLEQLRQHALKTKSSKSVTTTVPVETSTEPPKNRSEDEDSDTAELRLICLKSALLKKAMEMKHKQKLKKRLSQSQSVAPNEFILNDDDLFENIESDDNTDIEAMDMDIGSEGEDKTKVCNTNKNTMNSEQKDNVSLNAVPMDTVQDNENEISIGKEKPKENLQEDELDEDEDILRAKLLTSLTKNLPNLVDPSILNNLQESPEKKKPEPIANRNKPINKVPEKTKAAEKPKVPEKRLIINVGESDSEGENEATKNLKEMHKKLTEQKDFQLKLDMFLKSARKEVEKEKLPDVVQQPEPKTPEKFVAKAVNHLPKSEQMEYKNLVKRMAELEKIKQARQVSMTALKPRNAPIETNSGLTKDVDDQIALSRKNIAEESAKMLKLKEEASKLYQKYKIVATELRNISTAITLNKREQRTAQNRLAKIRIHHQRLLNSSNSRNSRSNTNSNHKIVNPVGNILPNIKSSNAHSKDQSLPEVKTLTISVVNELSNEKHRLPVEVDVGSNKKSVTSVAGSKSNKHDQVNDEILRENSSLTEARDDDKDRRKGDYESPLQALGGATWEADPHGILCPFEVGGHCKDSACKYLHPKPQLHSQR